MDNSIVAPIIYGENRHSTTNKGVVISSGIRQELQSFLSGFNASIGIEQTPYYRIDAYFNEQRLWILEINASFVDGWGTALNLARASGIAFDPTPLVFPRRFASESSAYLPELRLFVSELAHLGLHDHDVCEWNGNGVDPIYVYGRIGSKDQPHILPYDGLRLDNKLNLGMFSRSWDGDAVKTPRHYINRFDSWEKVPRETVLKFCDKGSVECERARQSVILKKPTGKARFIKQCYDAETLIAQDIVRPMKQDGNNCQLIIFAIGDEPITGYVQYSRSEIINDNSIHGPLRI
ncbi:MAG: hypothetical protein WC120_03745 [Parcubacteria group bacterium]